METSDYSNYEWDRIRDHHPAACTCYECNKTRRLRGSNPGANGNHDAGPYARWVEWTRERKRSGIVESDEERTRAWKAAEAERLGEAPPKPAGEVPPTQTTKAATPSRAPESGRTGQPGRRQRAGRGMGPRAIGVVILAAALAATISAVLVYL